MKKFEFEIQNCVKVVVEAKDVDEARMMLVDDSDLYETEMMRDCYISDGKEL